MTPELDLLAYVQGIDTSKWSGVIDWRTVKDSGLVKFVFNKATQGTTGIDTQWLNNKLGCNTVGIPNGAYHFFMPSLDAVQQAIFHVNTCGQGIKVYVCDVETIILAEAQRCLNQFAGGISEYTRVADLSGKAEYTPVEHEAIQRAIQTMTSGVGIASGSAQAITLAQMIKNFMERVYSLTKQYALIYTSPGFWNANVANDWIWDMPYELWVAHWGVQNPTIPRPWTTWKFWQYTTTLRIPGIPSAEDGNWARDTLDLVKYFGNGEEPSPPPPEYHLVKVTADTLNMRDRPWGLVIGKLRSGNILLVTGEQKDSYGTTWYYSGENRCFSSAFTTPYV